MTNLSSPHGASSDDAENSLASDRFPIVGIGASAGGVEASSGLLNALPEDTGMAFVVIQHLSADSPSFLSQIFGGETSLPVVEVAQNEALQPNHIYVIVPGMQITLEGDRLQLAPRDPNERPFMPIDRFFRSMATERQEGKIGVPIGVVLSGLDGDGANGLELIKAAGGVAFAQSKDSARFDDMPNTAMETGMVDFMLPPAEIACRIADMATVPYIMPSSQAEESDAMIASVSPDEPVVRPMGFAAVYALMRSHSGIDFSQYKRATFERRTRRRMALYHLSDVADYVERLNEDPLEASALYRDVLITVTGFFRDTEAFEFIGNVILPSLIQEKGVNSSIRIWVAGCSTGEECYSLAICLFEYLSAHSLNLSIQIFGTDASEDAVDKARQGIYTPNQMTGVSFERRQRFFAHVDDHYQVSKAVRELCVFARQDLSSDPPFSSIDLVSCRNVMIYFGTALQERVRSVFHYSLNPGGYLWLGSSESVGETSELFSAVDRKHKVYSRRATNSRPNFDFVTSSQVLADPKDTASKAEGMDSGYSNLRRQADQIALGRYAPAGVAIDEQLEILHFRGDTSAYLTMAPGEPSFSLLKLARPELLLELRAAIREAKEDNIVARREGLRVKDKPGTIAIEVTPIKNPVLAVRNYLVLFEETASSSSASADAATAEDEDAAASSQEVVRLERSLAALRRELLDTQAYLQSVVEEKEASNQRLTTANEEILSSNEELQSTNEELQTAKEEIQAANEELKTTNEELQDRNANASSTNDDLLNLLSNVNIPIVILSNDLLIRRFTPSAKELFRLIPTDIGRPLSDIRIDIDIPDLESAILATITSLDAQAREVQDSQGRWYQLRIRPYRTAENQIDGAVMALVDVNDIKRTQQQLGQARSYAEAIVETVSEPLLVVDRDLVVRRANRAFYETFQVSHVLTEGQSLFELDDGQWDLPEVRSHLNTLLANRCPIDPLEIASDFERIGSKTMLLKAREIESNNPDRLILVSIENITERKQAEAERLRLTQAQAARAEAEAANVGKDQFLSVISHEMRTPLNAILGWSSLLTRTAEPAPDMLRKALGSIHRSAQTQSRIIGDLLEVSRLAHGKVSLKKTPVNLSELLAIVVEMAQPSAAEVEVTITDDIESSSNRFLFDADRLHQAFGNALSNSIKFTSAGGRIQVSLVYESVAAFASENAGKNRDLGAIATARQARISIADNGIGIAPEFLPHIFDRFRQANSSNTREYGGLGIGLSVVQGFVEAHGGKVEIDSPGKGQGATLTIRLPLVPAALDLDDRVSPSQSSQNGELQGVCLLVVEDDLNSLEMMTTALELHGATVLSAESVTQAIEQLASEPQINLLVSDISLPNRDGFDLIGWVRSHDNAKIRQLPAVAVTGYATSAHTDSLLEAGFAYHLAKPIKIDSLLSAIAAVLPPAD